MIGTPQTSGTSQTPNGTPMYRGNPHVSDRHVGHILARLKRRAA